MSEFIKKYRCAIYTRKSHEEGLEQAFDASCVIKADAFRTAIDNELNSLKPTDLALMAKISSPGSINEVAKKLASYHSPIQIDFKAKFGVKKTVYDVATPKSVEPEVKDKSELNTVKKLENATPEAKKTWAKSKFFCSKCKTSISEKVAKFCFNNKKKFGGKAYCYNCQKHVTE